MAQSPFCIQTKHYRHRESLDLVEVRGFHNCPKISLFVWRNLPSSFGDPKNGFLCVFPATGCLRDLDHPAAPIHHYEISILICEVYMLTLLFGVKCSRHFLVQSFYLPLLWLRRLEISLWHTQNLDGGTLSTFRIPRCWIVSCESLTNRLRTIFLLGAFFRSWDRIVRREFEAGAKAVICVSRGYSAFGSVYIDRGFILTVPFS
jgi:hypothetical protein